MQVDLHNDCKMVVVVVVSHHGRLLSKQQYKPTGYLSSIWWRTIKLHTKSHVWILVSVNRSKGSHVPSADDESMNTGFRLRSLF